jgi:hypothetical protein
MTAETGVRVYAHVTVRVECEEIPSALTRTKEGIA